MIIVEVCQDTEHVCVGTVIFDLEMAGPLVITWTDFTVTVEVSQDTELFDLVEVYSGDGLAMSGHLAMTLV